jgi:glycosyltransferase involved in cell wall biosynthesis
VLIVSGIWPPDVGGPASHAPELADFLRDRGSQVEVVVTAERAPDSRAYPVRWVRRSLPRGVRHLSTVWLVARRAREVDVVYATSMLTRAALASGLARRPLVVKLTGDPAFERARRWGLARGNLDAYQQQRRGPRGLALDLARSFTLRRMRHVVCPSAYIRDLALAWGVPAERVTVLPNPAPPVLALADRAELRRRLALEGKTLAFAGRLTAAKALGIALEAVARTKGVSFLVAGDGDERSALERRARELGLDGRVRFLGPQPRERVLEVFRAADATILSSTWENFPHMVVEALAVGTPVIATSVGGVAEIVEDGRNGLLVPPGDAEALADAIGRFFADEGLRERLREAAAASVERYAPERIYEQLETILAAAAGRSP